MAELAGGDSTTIYDTAFAPDGDEEQHLDDPGDGDAGDAGDGDGGAGDADEEEVASPQFRWRLTRYLASGQVPASWWCCLLSFVPGTIFLPSQASFRGILAPSEPNDLFPTQFKCEVWNNVNFLTEHVQMLLWKSRNP